MSEQVNIEQCENGSVPSLGVNETVDAIMGELAKSFDKIVVDVAEQNKWCDSAVKELGWMVRPHIEQLVRERDLWHNEAVDAIAVKNHDTNAPTALAMAVEAKERAEQELAETTQHCEMLHTKNDEKFREIQMLTKECNEMKECVSVLRDYDHDLNCWLSDRKQALAKLDEAQKGGA